MLIEQAADIDVPPSVWESSRPSIACVDEIHVGTTAGQHATECRRTHSLISEHFFLLHHTGTGTL